MYRYLALTLMTLSLLIPAYSVQAEDGCCCETLSGFYIGAYGGGSFIQDSFFGRTTPVRWVDEVEYQAGWNVGGFLGYRFCCGLRLEGEIGYRKAELDQVIIHTGATNAAATDLRKSDFQVFNYMINAIYECSFVLCDCCWKPYFGAGFGAVNVDIDTSATGFDLIDDDTTYAYQLIIGLAYPACECLDIALEYRILGIGEAEFKDGLGRVSETREFTNSHNLLLSAKYIFGGL